LRFWAINTMRQALLWLSIIIPVI